MSVAESGSIGMTRAARRRTGFQTGRQITSPGTRKMGLTAGVTSASAPTSMIRKPTNRIVA